MHVRGAAQLSQALVAIPRYATVRKRVPFFALRLRRSGESKRRRWAATRLCSRNRFAMWLMRTRVLYILVLQASSGQDRNLLCLVSA